MSLGRTQHILCPVSSVLSHLLIRGPSDGPLFILPDGSPLARAVLISAVYQALQSVGLDTTRFSGHSFRIGAATTAASVGINGAVIKLLGSYSVGDIYAARFSFDDLFYRAEVIHVNNNGLIDVQFVDYGNKETVSFKDLHHLKPCFLSLPKQALCFALSGIQPVMDTWSPEACISEGGSNSLCRDDICFLGFWGFSPPLKHLQSMLKTKN